MDLFAVNWIAVALGALTGFVIGGLWYGPLLGKQWLSAVGLSEEDVQNGHMAKIYGGAFLLSVVISWTMAHTFQSYAELGADLSIFAKVMTGFGVALGFVVPAIGINYLFSQKTMKLFWIDAGYWLLFFTAVAAVHAYMP
ncbi:DUF1761 domain-containing protein [Qipengyuania nanhaisediminis]|uniref:DUF1761 domain-containing protein n=1 Tax=Qipengyuania nanhaisediminis TaxID=604088 RepID=UPI0038B37FD4